MVHVQAILFASLATSLFSAFLAMLGKQWLNRYESTDMRGSAIERSQNRQRKLDGIDAWYFDPLMESLPLMLQAALLLLGCALSRYLWDVDTTIAAVVLGITLFGLIFYLFITIAGATAASCPYQTPGSQLLRFLGRKFWNMLYAGPGIVVSVFRNMFKETICTIRSSAQYYHLWWSRGNIFRFLQDLVSDVPPAIAADAHRHWQAVIQSLAAFPTRALHLCRVYSQLHGPSSTPEQRSTWQTAVLGLRCISWTLQTSLDTVVHLSALKHLMVVVELGEFDPTLVVDCFNLFIGGINVNDGRLAVKQELEKLAKASAGCFCRALYRLTATDPTSSILEDIHQRYHRVFPHGIDLAGFPSHHSLIMVDALIRRDWGPRPFWNNDDKPPNHEYIPFAQDMAQLAQAEYQQELIIPNWILSFAFNSLSLDPLPSVSVVADCLKIIAIHLGCDVSNTTTLANRYIYLSFICTHFLIKI